MRYIDEKYINLASNQLLVFKQKTNNTYNFRCPYCGDSHKSKYKARGYLTLIDDGFLYKCHNCGKSTNLTVFLKDLNFSLYESYKKEKFVSVVKQPKKSVVVPSTNYKNKMQLGNKILRKLNHVKDIQVALDYCKNRHLPDTAINNLYYVDNARKIANAIPKYKKSKSPIPRGEAIVIPYIQNDIVTHIQMRYMRNTGLRYVTLEVEDTMRKIYGLDTVDKSKTVYVFEGVFDSMFVNGIAVANGALHTFIPCLNNMFDEYVLVYDKDYVYNKEIKKSLQKSISLGSSVVLYDTKILDSKEKDLNDFIKTKIITNPSEYLKNNTYTGFNASVKLNKTLL